MKLKRVTGELLKALGACPNARMKFARAFGKSAEITPANREKAEKLGLPLSWVVDRTKGRLRDTNLTIEPCSNGYVGCVVITYREDREHYYADDTVKIAREIVRIARLERALRECTRGGRK